MLKFCRVYFYASNSSLLTVFSFRYIKKPITYRDFFYNIYKERRKGRRIKGSSEKEEDGMAQKGETLVEVKDLCKNFGVTIALSHVDFVVKTGEIRGLIGENGSGKSTVSSIIAGM